MAAHLDNGSYTIEVTLNGGSGKASIKSPTALNVENGKMTAEIEWSSSHYDYMAVSGSDYFPVNTEGNSLFLIEVPALDRDIPIRAETLAMSQSHMIDYTLYFDSATIHKTGANSFGLPVGMACGAVIIACAAAFLWKAKPWTRRKSA